MIVVAFLLELVVVFNREVIMSEFFYEYRSAKVEKLDNTSSIKGKRLSSFLESGKIFSKEELYFITEQLLDILESMRSTFPPVVHTNINPINIIIKPNWEIALMGFGTKKSMDKYRAPEVLEQKTPKADLYSVGKVLADLAEGIDNKHFLKFLSLMTNEDMNLRFKDINAAKNIFSKLKDESIVDDDFDMKKNEDKVSAYDQYLIEKEVYDKHKYSRKKYSHKSDVLYEKPAQVFSVENYEDGGSLSLGEASYKEKSSDGYVKLHSGNKHAYKRPPLVVLVILVILALYTIFTYTPRKDSVCDIKGNNYSSEECYLRTICTARSDQYDSEKCKAEKKKHREEKLKSQEKSKVKANINNFNL